MVERGSSPKAVCVVATRLAERSRAVMARGKLYVLREVDGRELGATEAEVCRTAESGHLFRTNPDTCTALSGHPCG
jgi:hypothetical protein